MVRRRDGGSALDAKTVYAAGAEGALLKATDGGATWDSLPTGTRQNLLSLHFLDARVGYLSGNSGTLKKTRDGGASWDSLSPPNCLDLIPAVRAWDGRIAYYAGRGGRIWKTLDDGATWSLEVSRTTSALRAISLVDATTAYAAGDFGTIVKLSGGTASIAPSPLRPALPALRLLGGRLNADLPAPEPL